MGRRGVLAVCLATMLAGAAALAPRLLRDAPVTTGTPVRLDAVTAPIELDVQPICLEPVLIDAQTGHATVTVLHVGAGGARLRVTANTTGSWSSDGEVALEPLRDGAEPVGVPILVPARATRATVCLSAMGPGAVRVAGTADPRALTGVTVTREGVVLREAPSLTLQQGFDRAPVERVGQLADRAAALSPLGPWWYWLLLPLLVLGLPALVLRALALALREDG